ncbi:MAG: hypothetical protein M3304_12810 [Actinomycetota bacterium]|nr:hypothetical protein [Actinomycetota bacterium]
MRVELRLADATAATLEIENEQEFNDLLNGKGRYMTGWAQTTTGEYVQLSQVVSLRRFG